MKAIYLQIEDSKFDIFMNLIQNLKDDIIKNFYVENISLNNIETVSDKEQQEFEQIINIMDEDDKTISSKEIVSIWR